MKIKYSASKVNICKRRRKVLKKQSSYGFTHDQKKRGSQRPVTGYHSMWYVGVCVYAHVCAHVRLCVRMRLCTGWRGEVVSNASPSPPLLSSPLPSLLSLPRSPSFLHSLGCGGIQLLFSFHFFFPCASWAFTKKKKKKPTNLLSEFMCYKTYLFQ